MSAIIDALIGPAGAALAGIVAVTLAWLAGSRAGRLRGAVKQAQGYQKTMEDALNAPVALSPDAARDSLRKRKPGQH